LRIGRFLSRLARRVLAASFTRGIYERILWSQIRDGEKPNHIGIILDGNRRWASTHGLPPWAGHNFGADKVEEFLDWCVDLGVSTLTIYVFSTENFNRPEREVKAIMDIAREKLKQILKDERIHRNKIRIKALGRLDLLPKDVRELISEVEKATESYDKFYLNVAIAYGGRAEIVDATRRIADKVKSGEISPAEIDEHIFEKHLYTSHLPDSDPDLVIRTSGEERLSGFLLWQSAYSELVFLDVYWPDFRKIDLWRAIRTFQGRSRRYGR